MNFKINKPNKSWEKWDNKDSICNKILSLIKDNKKDKLDNIEKYFVSYTLD